MNQIIKNCFTIFKQFKTATFLNVTGLSVAFAVFIVIATQLRHEFTFDTTYKNAAHIYRMEVYDSVSQQYSINSSMQIYETVATHFTGIENWGGYVYHGKFLITRIDESGNRCQYSESIGFITSSILDIFSINVVAGDAKATLDNPQQCLLPLTMAHRIFGTEYAVGKTLIIDDKEIEVGAVYADFPKNSSLSDALFRKLDNKSWNNWSEVGFFQLSTGVDVATLNQKINTSDAASLGIPEGGERYFNIEQKRFTFFLKPIKESYFSKTVTYGYGENGSNRVGNKTLSYVLMLVGLLIMVIAYINFTNFSTALAPVRIKSINTRQVMGASQGGLQRGIMAEAAIISLLSFALSLLWVSLFSKSTLSTAFFANPTLAANMEIVVITAILSLLLGLLAGAYPAVYLTSFTPALVLNGSFALTPQGIRLRNTLITIQFCTSIALITGTLFIKLQHDYMRNRPIGMKRENVVIIGVNQEKNIVSQINAVAHEMMQNPHIHDFTTSSNIPGSIGMGWGRSFYGTTIQVRAWPVGHNFLRFFGIPIIEGEDFFEHNEKGTNKYVFNRKTVDKYGLESPIGKELTGYPKNNGTIVGIAENVNFASLHIEIEPLIFICGDDQPVRFLFFKINGVDTPATIAHIKNVFSKFGENPIDLRFLDEELDKLYKKEADLANIISLFSLIAIIISLMGIYGLILFNAKFKVREIGIRKVNGASEMEIILLLNRGFLQLIAIAFIIATPISYYLIFSWLKGFPYRVAIYWWVFALAGFMTLLITLLTVSYQSWKAAAANPTKSLKV